MSVLNELKGLKSVVTLTSSWKGLQLSRGKSAFHHSSFYYFLPPLWLHLFACPAQYARFIRLQDGGCLWLVNLQNIIDAQFSTDIGNKSESWR